MKAMKTLPLLIIVQALWQFEVNGIEPQFDSEPVNITAIKGHAAILPCAVLDKGKHKIIWMNQKSILISTEDRRVIDDTRMSIERPFTQAWNLHIRNVVVADDGEYTCQINTNPIKVKRVRLKIQVPAVIDNVTSSHDMTVTEGAKVELTCVANGIPPPVIRWFKKTPNTKNKRQHIGTTGETLVIYNITRYCGGLYECQAENNISGTEPQTRSMNVEVKFPPEVTFKTRRIGQKPGKETMLECIVTASPHAVNIWKKDGNRVPANTQTLKYRTDIYKDGNFTRSLYLRILNLEKKDFGEYTCEASNDLGKDTESIVLYEYRDPTTPKPETTTWSRPRPPSSNGKYYNLGGITGKVQTGINHYNGKYPTGYPPIDEAYSSGTYVNLSSSIVLFISFIAVVTALTEQFRYES